MDRLQEKNSSEESREEELAEVDLATFHEREAGRLILDPEEARIEFGERFTSRLKLTKDGKTILWPQPTDDPADPQNWSSRKKALHLFIISLATIVPDFDSAIGIASVFELAETYGTTTGHINNLTSNWSVFLVGWGGFFGYVFSLPQYRLLTVCNAESHSDAHAKIWTTASIVLDSIIGTRLSRGYHLCPDVGGLRSNALSYRILRNVSSNHGIELTNSSPAPAHSFVHATQGLFIINDVYPFHLQVKMIGIWTCSAVLSPHLSPFVFSFLLARANWRIAWGIGCIYGVVVVLLIAFFMEESIYDRKKATRTVQPGLRGRFEALFGVTGYKMAKTGQSATWKEVMLAPLRIAWRPHFVGVYVLLAMFFGFAIGINVSAYLLAWQIYDTRFTKTRMCQITNTIFFQSEPPFGFGFDKFTVGGIYATPVVAVFIGEFLGRYLNDWVMYYSVKRNNGVFEAEVRLWTLYISIPLYLCGFLVLGTALQHHLHIAVIVIGWGIAQIADLMSAVAVYAYSNDCFPTKQGEVSAVLNLMRTMGGFSVAYYQVPWSEQHGALQTFGLEAGIVCGIFILVVPILQLKGREIRVCWPSRELIPLRSPTWTETIFGETIDSFAANFAIGGGSFMFSEMCAGLKAEEISNDESILENDY
ncbi:mfs transporter [Moniliophthora roreri]|nr:mfs transporter [Moniliophthora roreri]